MHDQEINPEVNGQAYAATEIYAGIPEDFEEEIEVGTINKSDFEGDIEDATLLEEIKDNYEERKEEILEVDGEDVRQKELSEKAAEVKKKFVSMINPKSVIGFADFALSRAGSFAMVKTDRKDWRLDPEEKEFLAEVLEVMIEEEGIEFWPAKVWLILALIFFYGMKVMENYERYYSSRAKELGNPQQLLEEATRRKEIELAALEAEIMEVEILEKRAEVERRKRDALYTIRNGEAPKKTETPPQDIKEKVLSEIEKEKEELLKKYPPEEYEWKNGELSYRKNGEPRKRRGRKTPARLHPTSGKFISEEDWKKLVISGEYDEYLSEEDIEEYEDERQDQEEPEFVNAEEV